MWKRWTATFLALVAVVAMARTAELYIDGAWVDVTTGGYVLAEDPITITDGADSQSVLSSPGSCTLSLLDKDKNGRWSNRVPGSTYFRKLGRNTPLRISVDGDVRCVMEVPEWAPRWELGDAKVRVPVQAAGILRRLSEGARALRPAIERKVLAGSPVAFWPLADGANSTSAASALPDGKPMTLDGTMAFAAVEGPLGQTATPELLDADGAYTGQLAGLVTLTADTQWQVDFSVRAVPLSGGGTNQGGAPVSFPITDSATFAYGKFTVIHDNGFGTPTINVNMYDGDGNTVSLLSSVQQGVDSLWHHITIKYTQSGGNFTGALWVDGVSVATDTDAGDIGRPTTMYVPHAVDDDLFDPLGSLSVANLAVFNDDSAPADRYEAFTGYAGEAAGRRIERLCGEEGVTFASVGDLDDTAAMGPQTADTLLDNLEAAAVADQGRLYETRTALGLTYRTRVSLYNQYGPLLEYQHLVPPLEPTEDLTFAHNDVTVSRPDGSAARSTLDTAVDPYHTLTTQAPPDGIGTYDTGTVTANVETDDQLNELADWLRHLGTCDELRYPSLTVEFASPVWTFETTLKTALLALETGDQVRLDGLPAWLPPDQYAAIVQGRTEVIGTHTHSITWNLRPGWPWEAWQLESGGSTLVAAASAVATSLKLATSVGPPWSTTREPYHIQIAGEAMTVTAMTTDTVAHIATGAASYADNANVTPALPAGITPDVGQLLLILAAGRTQGTHLPTQPAGWTTIVDSNNFKLFGKYYVTGDAAPAISFTGGAAGSTTGAQMAAFSGLSMELDMTAIYPDGWVSSGNGSAQNIAYPQYLNRRTNSAMLILGHKLDDWTSVATIAGTSEVGDSSSTSGNDMGLVWDLYNPGTPTTVVAGSFTVTGGASAASEGIVVGLRPLQTATVERGINGASVSLAAGEAVHGWRLGVVGL